MLADWSVSIFQQPPTNAEVGDFLAGIVTIVNDAGPDDLTVNSISVDATSVGVDSFNEMSGAPFSMAAGTSANVNFSFRLKGAPGSIANKLAVKVAAQLGAVAPENKTAATRTIASKEAVTATLTAADDSAPSFSGDAAAVTPLNRIRYTLVLFNSSDTDAQLNGLPAGFIAPGGTSQFSRSDGTTAVSAGVVSTWSLTVDVNNNLTNGAVLTQLPVANYSMADISLASRSVPISPTNFISVVKLPVLTIEKLSSVSARLSWPANETGFTLWSNTNLVTTNWTTASPPGSVFGTNNVVTNAMTGTQKFYRLRGP
jgi:hypothetical protein